MADVVNLRLARKQAKRRHAEQEATQRRLAHGRSKAEKTLQRSQSDQAERALDRHRLDNGDDS